MGVFAASSHPQRVSEAAGIRMAKGSLMGLFQGSVAAACRRGFPDMPDIMAPALTEVGPGSLCAAVLGPL